MPHDVDQLLGRLAAAEVCAPANLDQAVLAAIATRRADERRARALAPVRMISVGLAMALGVGAGGFAAATAAAESHHLGAFSADTHLAPSVLLEGRR
ncbi:MAG: hypothetical protein JF588_18205 [Caulobacterales bacterium]|nr:hypothetical protein [Caulobacterales bacterium]